MQGIEQIVRDNNEAAKLAKAPRNLANGAVAQQIQDVANIGKDSRKASTEKNSK